MAKIATKTATATATATATNNVANTANADATLATTIELINSFLSSGNTILPNDKKKEMYNSLLINLKSELSVFEDDSELASYIRLIRKNLTQIGMATKLTNLKSLINDLKDVLDLIETVKDIENLDSFITYGKQVIRATLQDGMLKIDLPLMNNGTATSQKSGKTYDYLSRSGTGFYSSQILDVDGVQYSITFSIYKEISK